MSNEDAVPPTGEKESTLDLAREFAIAYDDGTFDEDSLGRFVDVLRVEIARELYVAPTAEQAEGVRVARDAARYRLIRAGFGDFGPEADLHNAFVDGGEKLDAALDKLLAAPASSTGDQA
jgi:hypothetical protein